MRQPRLSPLPRRVSRRLDAERRILRASLTLVAIAVVASFGGGARAGSTTAFTGTIEHVLPLSPPGDPEPLFLVASFPEGISLERQDVAYPPLSAAAPWVARWSYASDVRSAGSTNRASLHLVQVADPAARPDDVVRDSVRAFVASLVSSGWEILIPLREMGFRSRSVVRGRTVRTYAGEFAAKDGYWISGSTGKNERENYLLHAIVTPSHVVLLLCANNTTASKFTEAFRIVPSLRAANEPTQTRVRLHLDDDEGRSLSIGFALPTGFGFHHARVSEGGAVDVAGDGPRPIAEWRRAGGPDSGPGRIVLDAVPHAHAPADEWAAWLKERSVDHPSPTLVKDVQVGDVRVFRAYGTGGGPDGRTVFEVLAAATAGTLVVIVVEERAIVEGSGVVAVAKRVHAAADVVLARLALVRSDPFRAPSTAK